MSCRQPPGLRRGCRISGTMLDLIIIGIGLAIGSMLLGVAIMVLVFTGSVVYDVVTWPVRAFKGRQQAQD